MSRKEAPDESQRLIRCRKFSGVGREDVHHALPDVNDGINLLIARSFDVPTGIVEQNLIQADMKLNRW